MKWNTLEEISADGRRKRTNWKVKLKCRKKNQTEHIHSDLLRTNPRMNHRKGLNKKSQWERKHYGGRQAHDVMHAEMVQRPIFRQTALMRVFLSSASGSTTDDLSMLIFVQQSGAMSISSMTRRVTFISIWLSFFFSVGPRRPCPQLIRLFNHGHVVLTRITRLW